MKTKLLLVLLLFLTRQQLSAQWVQQTSGTNSTLYSINFINSNTGFCVGENSLILKTTNGGNNWLTLPSPITIRGFGYVRMFSADNIVIGVKDSNIVLRSSDGGIEWNVYTASMPAFFTKIETQFTDFNNGYILTTGFFYKTSDGGQNWTSLSPPIVYRDINFINANTGWACGTRQFGFPPPGSRFTEIHRTNNGGINWNTLVSIPEVSYSIYRVFFLNALTGFHNDFSQLSIKKSGSGGATWSVTSGAGQYKTYYDMSFPSDNTGWSIGSQNIKTTDGGQNWEVMNVPFGNIYNSVYFVDNNTGWMAGSGGTIIKTITGGVTNINIISNELPGSYELYQNYPNPFNPNSKIKFNIPENGFAKLAVYDITGKELVTLVNQSLSPGTYEVDFNGIELSSGIYFYTLKTSGFSDTKKMMLIK